MRYEPITYWMVMGSKVVTNGVERKLEKLRYALTGNIPDGMLVRVSSLNRDEAVAFKRQEAFIKDLSAALDEYASKKIMGTASL